MKEANNHDGLILVIEGSPRQEAGAGPLSRGSLTSGKIHDFHELQGLFGLMRVPTEHQYYRRRR